MGCWSAGGGGDFAGLLNHPSVLPVAPPGGEFARVVVARHHACAIDAGGAVVCWGHPHDGIWGHSRYLYEKVDCIPTDPVD